jgi:predicted nucleic acid-binding protein
VILLDTNVISQAMKPDGNSAVRSWLSSKLKSDLYLCAPVLAELWYGAEILPSGRKRDALLRACELIEREKFAGRILSFDQMSARHFARLRAIRKVAGEPLPVMDGVIASIAAAHSMTLATGNTKHFQDLGVPLVDPFSD